MRLFVRAHRLILQAFVVAVIGIAARLLGGIELPVLSIRSGQLDAVLLSFVAALAPALCWSAFRDRAESMLELTFVRSRRFCVLQVAASGALVLEYLVLADVAAGSTGAVRNAVLAWAFVLFAQAFSYRYFGFIGPVVLLLVCVLFGRGDDAVTADDWAVFARPMVFDGWTFGWCTIAAIGVVMFIVRRARP